MVKFAAVWDVAAPDLTLQLLTNETRVNSCATLLTQQLVVRFESLIETVEVEHPAALTLTGHQVLTSLLTHLTDKLFFAFTLLCPV